LYCIAIGRRVPFIRTGDKHMAAKASNPVPIATPKLPKMRSPNYPSMSLPDAVGKLHGLYDAMKRHSVGVESIAAAMKLKYTSSTGKLALAALRAYGLLDDDSKGMAKLSERALDIIDYGEGSPYWKRAIQDAALAPNMHRTLWGRYGADLPGDDELRRVLAREYKFNDKSIAPFIDEYKQTIAFSGLAKDSPNEKNGGTPPAVQVGDYVQWSPQGAAQFEQPRRVRWVSDDGVWAAVDDNDMGLPMAELSVESPPAGIDPPVPPMASSQKPPLAPPVVPRATAVTGGPRIEFPLPNENAIEIRLKKPVSKKDFDRIIKLVQLSEDSLVGGDE
jgi:hypothetical protein